MKMLKYAQILNEETKLCTVGTGTNTEFYKSIGMEEMEVEQAYDGNWYVKGCAPAQPLEQVKAEKVELMKAERDRVQELPIEYNGKSFDYNKESLQKLNEAKDCLEGTEDIQIWICADNSLTYLNYNDIMAIKRLGKERSNNVHIQYAKLKYLIEMAKTAEEVEEITFETDTSTIPLEV